MASNFRKIKNPEPIIPGRRVDFQMGGQPPVQKRTYQLLRELEEVKSEIGAVDVETTPATANDVLVFNGTTWTPVDRTQLLALTHLTDVTLVSATEGNFLVKGSGDWANQNYTPGKLGVGTSANPTHRIEWEDDDYTAWYTGSASNLKSGARGFHMSKAKDRALPNTISFHTDGWPNWEIGMDFDTDNSLSSGFGNSDFVLAFDHSANSNGGADVIRISPEEASSVSASCKIVMGRLAGTPKDNTSFLVLDGGDNTTPLGGLAVNFFGSSTTNGLDFVNRSNTVSTCRFNWNNLWISGTDLLGTNASDLWLAFDSTSNRHRLFVKQNNEAVAKVGVGSTNPQAAVSVLLDSGASADDTVQRAWHSQIANTPSNRAINLETIRKAGVEVWNYIWTGGGLGSGSTAATRVATSTGGLSWGLEGGDSQFGIVSAVAGTDQSLTRPFRVDHSGGVYRVGFFNVTPQARPAAYTNSSGLTGDRTLAAYTADDESGAYTGIDNAQVGSVYATVADLNALRTAYETLRALVEDHVKWGISQVGDLTGYGLFQ